MDMTTHEVEEMLSITKKTLIYYENEGLVKPARDSNNYRNYNQEDVSIIKFIIKRNGCHDWRNQTNYKW